MKEEVKLWVEHSEKDLDTAEYLFEGKRYNEAAFFCQQSVEKALKALLLHKKGEFPRVHDLTNLARLVDAHQKIIELCAKLNPAYVATRYPDTPKRYSSQECNQLVGAAKEVLMWIKKNLP